jgi:hypothetical protein
MCPVQSCTKCYERGPKTYPRNTLRRPPSNKVVVLPARVSKCVDAFLVFLILIFSLSMSTQSARTTVHFACLRGTPHALCALPSCANHERTIFLSAPRRRSPALTASPHVLCTWPTCTKTKMICRHQCLARSPTDVAVWSNTGYCED